MAQSVWQIPGVLPAAQTGTVRRLGPAGAAAADLLSLTTAVLWCCCLAVGVLGLWLSYPRPRASAALLEPAPTQIVNVAVVKQPPPPLEAPMTPPAAAPPTPDLAAPAPAPALPAAAAAPPLTAVAAPSAALAFALPVEGLTRVVDIGHASFVRPARLVTTVPTGAGPGAPGNGAGRTGGAPLPAISAPPVVAHLTLGQGEGRQPIPDYPHDAVTQRQEGTVGVRFNVDENGRVSGIQAVRPCRWPLLNQAALRAVRERWRFNPGPPRVYDVAIVFQLEQ